MTKTFFLVLVIGGNSKIEHHLLFCFYLFLVEFAAPVIVGCC